MNRTVPVDWNSCRKALFSFKVFFEICLFMHVRNLEMSDYMEQELISGVQPKRLPPPAPHVHRDSKPNPPPGPKRKHVLPTSHLCSALWHVICSRKCNNTSKPAKKKKKNLILPPPPPKQVAFQKAKSQEPSNQGKTTMIFLSVVVVVFILHLSNKNQKKKKHNVKHKVMVVNGDRSNLTWRKYKLGYIKALRDLFHVGGVELEFRSFQTFLELIGCPYDHNTALTIFRTIDAPASGAIDFQQFINW
ncbi:hypothetical protein RFI_37993, partial [Reticulomyxa filosa]